MTNFENSRAISYDEGEISIRDPCGNRANLSAAKFFLSPRPAVATLAPRGEGGGGSVVSTFSSCDGEDCGIVIDACARLEYSADAGVCVGESTIRRGSLFSALTLSHAKSTVRERRIEILSALPSRDPQRQRSSRRLT